MNKFFIAVLSFTFTACSTLGISEYQPDKRDWRAVTCSGFKGWTDCKEKARLACPNGFDMANQHENTVTQDRSMEFACKP